MALALTYRPSGSSIITSPATQSAGGGGGGFAGSGGGSGGGFAGSGGGSGGFSGNGPNASLLVAQALLRAASALLTASMNLNAASQNFMSRGNPGGVPTQPRRRRRRRGFLRNVPRWLQNFTNQSNSLIGNRYAGAGAGLAKFAGRKIGGMIPGLAGSGAKALGGAFGSLVTATVSLTNTFLERARELAKFSPEIAFAQATADVREMFADMREAKQLGPGLGKLTESSTDIWISIRDAILPIKRFLVETLVAILEPIATIMRTIGPVLETIAEILGTSFGVVIDLITLNFSKAWEDLKGFFGRILNIWSKDEKKEADKAWEDLLNNTFGVGGNFNNAGNIGQDVLAGALGRQNANKPAFMLK